MICPTIAIRNLHVLFHRKARIWVALPGVLLLQAGVFLQACAPQSATVQREVSAATSVLRTPAPAKTRSGGYYKVGSSYTISGVRYYPAEDWDYEEVGIASWYGPGFHGKKTANGEVFDQDALTAAHRTLPMPSIVEVTNLENDRTVVLRVNDRGPFAHNRIIDLSKRAAQVLRYERHGVVRVRVRLLREETMLAVADIRNQGKKPKPRTSFFQRLASAFRGKSARESRHRTPEVAESAPHATAWYVQAGSFSSLRNARQTRVRLSGIAKTRVYPKTERGTRFFRVRLGPFATVGESRIFLRKVVQKGFSRARIVAVTKTTR